MNSLAAKIIGRARQEVQKEFAYLSVSRRPAKILFDHLPKCGGSSLNTYLAAHYPMRKTFSINGLNPNASVEQFKRLPQARRHGYDLINGHLANALLNCVHPDCLKITMLREPVDRIISHYYYVRRTPTHYLHETVTASGMGLADYAVSGLSEELRNWYTAHFSGLTAVEAEQAPEAAVNTALDGVLNHFDLVGFVDAFSSFTDALLVRANLRHAYRGRKVNLTPGRAGIEEVPETALRAIRQVNQLDIVLYNKIKAAVDPCLTPEPATPGL